MTRRNMIGSMAGVAVAAVGNPHSKAFAGFVGQEFVPSQKEKLASLRKCIQICDV